MDLVESWTRGILAEFTASVRRTGSERLAWRPSENARSVLELAVECAEYNERWARTLETGAFVPWDAADAARWAARITDVDSAIAGLAESVERFLTALAKVCDLDAPLLLPWEQAPIGRSALRPIWHMAYHDGQINYIQTLHGEMRQYETWREEVSS